MTEHEKRIRLYANPISELDEPSECAVWAINEIDTLRKEVARLNQRILDDNKAYGCELRDPDGTIWEHAAKLKAEIERWRDATNRLRSEMEQQSLRANTAEAEVARLREELKAVEFWRAHAERTNSEFEADYLEIWKAVKEPDKTVVESVMALKAEAIRLAALAGEGKIT